MIRCLGYKDNFVAPSKRHLSALTQLNFCGKDNILNSLGSILFSSSWMYRRTAFSDHSCSKFENYFWPKPLEKVICITSVLKHRSS